MIVVVFIFILFLIAIAGGLSKERTAHKANKAIIRAEKRKRHG